LAVAIGGCHWRLPLAVAIGGCHWRLPLAVAIGHRCAIQSSTKKQNRSFLAVEIPVFRYNHDWILVFFSFSCGKLH
jgi:hypothetical protein